MINFLNIFERSLKEIVKYFKKIWFEAKLKARLSMIEWENKQQAEFELEEKNRPIYSEKPVDPLLQTGESKNLGGEMRLTAPWFKEEEK